MGGFVQNSAGEVSIQIVGDYSSLRPDFDQAMAIAVAGGATMAEALQATLAAPDTSGIIGAIQGVGDSATKTAADAAELEAAMQAIEWGQFTQQANELEAAMAQIAAEAQEMNTAMETIAKGVQEEAAAGDAAAVANRELLQSLLGVGDAAGTAAPQVQKFDVSLEDMAGQLIAFQALSQVAAGIEDFGAAALEAYGSLEKADLSLKALTGSAAQAENILNGLKAVAIDDALSFPDLVKAQQRMTALGFSTQQASDVIKAAANGAAVTGDAFSSVARKLENMALSGNAAGRQLATLGLSSYDLGRILGTTGDQASKAFKALDESQRLNVLTTAMQKFGDVAKEAAAGIEGQWTNLGTEVTFTMQQLGAELAPIAADLIKIVSTDILPFLQEMIADFHALPGPVKDAAVAIAALVAAIAPLAAGLAGLGLVISGITAALPALEAGMALLTGTIAGPLTAGVLAAAAAAAVLFKTYSDGTASLHSLDAAFAQYIEHLATGAQTAAEAAAAETKIQQALEQGLITTDQATKAFALLADTQKKLVGSDWKAWESAAGVSLRVLADDSKQVAAGVKAIDDAQTKANDSLKLAGEVLDQVRAGYQAGTQSLQDLNRATVAYDAALKAANGTAKETKEFFSKGMIFGNMSDQSALIVAEVADIKRAHEDVIKEFAKEGVANIAEGWAAAFDRAGTKLATMADLVAPALQAPEDAFEKLTAATEKLLNTTPVTNFAADWKALGLAVDDVTGSVQRKGVKAFEDIAEAGIFSGDRIQAAWGAVSNQVDRLAKTDLPAAIHAYDEYISELNRTGAAVGTLISAEEKRTQLIINQKSLTGASATAEIANMVTLAEKQQILIDKSQLLGNTYKSLVQDFNGAFQTMAQGIAKGITSGEKFSTFWHQTLNAIETQLLTTLVQGAFKALANVILGPVISALGQLLGATTTTAIATKAVASALDVSQVIGNAAVAAAAAEAATAAIPIVGPALAPEAGAAMFAQVVGTWGPLASFDKGGWIPDDMLAMVHKGEYVSTASNAALGNFGPGDVGSGNDGGGGGPMFNFAGANFYGTPSQAFITSFMNEAVRQLRAAKKFK